MRLNPDCVRDILLVVEELSDGQHGIDFDFHQPVSYERLSKYSNNELWYHVRQCDMSGYFTPVSWYLSGDCAIFDLSPKGHQFIADIRSDSVWNKVKSNAAKIGVFSLNALAQIATGVVTEVINSQIHS